MGIVKIDSLESTNKYCEALDLTKVEDFTCYWALEQTAGIGQRGNHWHSAPGLNLTFSLVLHPTFLPADHQFKLTETLSLAILDLLNTVVCRRLGRQHLPLTTTIKWPNDIYVDNRKICGTLVSTRLNGNAITSAVCGIGLNVNQTVFPQEVPNPTSLSLLTGHVYDLESLLQQLLGCIEVRYNALKAGVDPESEYLGYLMNLGIPARYRYKEKEITATITGVDPHGRLLLTATDGGSLCCSIKEIVLL